MYGFTASPGKELKKQAPTKAPTDPGKIKPFTTFLSTLPNRKWEMPEAPVVTTSAKWTEAEAMDGEIPKMSSRVVELTPYAIPKEPSISWATKPANAKSNNRCTYPIPFSLEIMIFLLLNHRMLTMIVGFLHQKKNTFQLQQILLFINL